IYARTCVHYYGKPLSISAAARKHIFCDSGIFCGGTAPEFFLTASLIAEILGRNIVILYIAVSDLRHTRFAAGADFIKAIIAVYDKRIGYAELYEGISHFFNKIFAENAEHHHFRPCGICKGAENIKHRSDAYLFSDRAHIFHCAVVFLSKKETDVRSEERRVGKEC